MAVAAAVLAVVSASPAAGADELAHLERVGWWWSLQTGLNGIELTPPADVPEGGILVQADATGPSAIGALRWILPAASTDITLSLVAATPGTAAASTLRACPADGFWLPAHGGWWSLRAEADCDAASVDGVLAEDGVTWTWLLDDLASDRVVDVVLIPDSIVPFRVVLQPPVDTALAFTPTPAGVDPIPAAPSAAPVPAPDVAPTVAPPSVVGPPVSAPNVPPTVEQPRPPQVAPPEQPGDRPVVSQPAAAGATDTRSPHPLALVLLGALLAGAATWLRSPGETDRDGGLGRFQRARASHPTPLR